MSTTEGTFYTASDLYIIMQGGWDDHSLPKLLSLRGGASRHDPGSGGGGANWLHQTSELLTNDGKGAYGEKVPQKK